MATLQTLQGPKPGKIFELEGNSITLGRHPDCDIVLEVAAVSRQHARILLVDGKYYVEDLSSRNGTLLNGRPLVRREVLREHDQLGICDLVFIFHHGQPDLELPVARRQEEGAEPPAMVIDDEGPTGNSTVMSKVDISTGPASLSLGANAEAKLKAVLEISQNLRKALALKQVLPKLLDSLFTIFIQADRGFVVLLDPASGRLVPKAVKYRRGDDRDVIRISRTIIHEVMATKEAVLSADAATDKRFDMAESIADFHIRSMMCAPLINSEGKAVGVIQIDTVNQRNRFSREDLDVPGERGLPGGLCRGERRVARDGAARAGAGAGVAGRPRGPARLPARRLAAASSITNSSPSTSRPTSSAATITTIFRSLADGWRWWWRTCRARAFRPRS